jgi:predicted nucleotidyltransferase
MTLTQYEFYKTLTKLPFIKEIWLFGSRARGDNQDRADIDLAILCPTATREEEVKIQDTMDQADTLLKIDWVRLDTLPESSDLKRAIEQQGVKLYEQL